MKPNEILLDIETRKVDTWSGDYGYPFIMPNGEPLRKRWQPFLIGLGLADGSNTILDETKGGERGLYYKLGVELYGIDIIYYSATRDFDEMVLRGRFTNARRAHLPKAGPWPYLKGAHKFKWINLRKLGIDLVEMEREGDIPSREVPQAWDVNIGERPAVLRHLTYDLEQLRITVNKKEKNEHR